MEPVEISGAKAVKREGVTAMSQGLPGEFLLLFTLILWGLFLAVYLGNRKSNINKWFFICGMLFSVGVLKEYLYYSLFPQIVQAAPSLMNEETALCIYSVLTAIPYYFATPALFITGLYFSRMETRRPGLFPWIKIIAFVPGIIMAIVFPITETRFFQLNDKGYYTLISVYNLIAALLGTVLFLSTLVKEHNPKVKRQKLAIAVLALVPSWFTIMATIPVQLFAVQSAEKVWQSNLIVILVLACIYIYLVFKEGFMGSRLRHETYRWDQDEKLVGQTMQTIRHMLKNQISKIEWCAKNISENAEKDNLNEYTEIIMRSTKRISDFLHVDTGHGADFECSPRIVDVRELIENAVRDFEKRYTGVIFGVSCMPGERLFCDPRLTGEALCNLIQNSVEAMDEKGCVTIEYKDISRKLSCIKITDSGKGLPEKIKDNLFLPYVSLKDGGDHWGMGLYYCQKSMLSHGGRIEAYNNKDGGAVFTLWFPKEKKKGLALGNEKREG